MKVLFQHFKIVTVVLLAFGLVQVASAHQSINEPNQTKQVTTELIVGAAQFELYLEKLAGKRVGLIVNQTAVVGEQHLVDVLLAKGVNVVKLFAPEHGIRGNKDAGEKFDSDKDPITGLPINSLYGKTKQPNRDMLADVDVLIFDIQDVGVRFYTYINTLFYSMQAAQAFGKQFIVLDRPNPHIATIDGPMLDPKFSSFVGLLPVPMVHGMTVGELAKMIKGEGWLQAIPSMQALNSIKDREPSSLDLTVIPVKNYHRKMRYDLPIAPSPNLPNSTAVGYYPSLCLFEATPISIGRGTHFPFQVIGFDKVAIGDFKFTPISIPGKSKYPKLEGIQLTGEKLPNYTKTLDGNPAENVQVGLDLSYLLKWHELFKANDLTFFSRPQFFDQLAGTNKLRLALLEGKSPAEIREDWQPGLQAFKRQRKPYLIYP